MNTVHSLLEVDDQMSHSTFVILYSANNTTFYIGFKLNDSKFSTDCNRYVHWPTTTEWLDFVSNSHKLSYVCVVTLRKQYSWLNVVVQEGLSGQKTIMVEVVNLGEKIGS